MPTPTHHPGKDLPVTAFLALAGALILAGVATFGYFGGYWYQYFLQVRSSEVKLSRTDNFRSADDE